MTSFTRKIEEIHSFKQIKNLLTQAAAKSYYKSGLKVQSSTSSVFSLVNP
jgi:hypothetical protein